MYELLIIAYLFQGSTDGGVSVSMKHLEMPTKELCEDAKKAIDDQGTFLKAGMGAPIGGYATRAKCIKKRP